jgi:hypothetical protein
LLWRLAKRLIWGHRRICTSGGDFFFVTFLIVRLYSERHGAIMVIMVRTLVQVFRTVAKLSQSVTTVGHETELHNLCAKLDQIEDCVQQVGIMYGGIRFLEAVAAAAAIFRRYKINVDQMKGRNQLELNAKIEYALQNAEEALRELDREEVSTLLSSTRQGPRTLLVVLRKNLVSLKRKLEALPRVAVSAV